MPDYRYHCDFYNVDETVNRKMEDYNPEEPCEVCHKPMKRITEDLVNSGAIWKCNGDYNSTRYI